jgi:hypothetical protein
MGNSGTRFSPSSRQDFGKDDNVPDAERWRRNGTE